MLPRNHRSIEQIVFVVIINISDESGDGETPPQGACPRFKR
jgi:hypothetical protein